MHDIIYDIILVSDNIMLYITIVVVSL